LLAVGSHLENFSTFDPLEEVDVEMIASTFGRLREAISGDEYDFVCQLTRECCALGRDGFIWVVEQGEPQDLGRFLRCVREIGKLHSAWPDISEAVLFCVKGNALVLNFDMRRFFDVMWFIFAVCIDDEELVTGYALLLHELRPLLMPMFSFSWVQLVGDRRLLHELLVRFPNGQDLFLTLLCDFEATVAKAQDSTNPGVFRKLYDALLRLILVLAHDFPKFLFQVASEIVLYLAPTLLQLRNIILAVYVGPSSPLPNDARRNLLQLPGIDVFVEIPQPLPYLVERFGFSEAVKNVSALSELAERLESQKEGGAIAAFVIFLMNAIVKILPIASIVSSIETTHLYVILSGLIEKLEHEATLMVINSLLDQLRPPSKTTVAAFEVLLALFRNDITSGKVGTPINFSEMLLRAVLERAATPPPHPWGLQLFLCELLENTTHGLWEMPCVLRSKAVERFLQCTKQVFGLASA
jgi:CCR4-NOT transcription complex subunit 1